jgi:acyl-CoA thioesterase-2
MTGIWRDARESRYDPFGMKDPCAHGEPASGCCLVRQLRLTRTGDRTFTGMTRGGRSATGRSFGGGLAAQALLAAGATVPDGQAPGSLHAYFVTPGDASRPVRYTVTTVGEGQSWALRQVTADQDGTVRLAMHTSFRRFGATSGSEHQRATPALGTPPTAGREPGDRAPQDGGGDQACTCKAGRATPPCGLDVEPAAAPEAIEPSAAPGAHRATWLRARHGLGELPLWHAVLLTYASDLGTLMTVDQPHVGEPGTRRAASVDHAVWFHRPFRFDDWLWYGQRSPVLTGGRGMFEGSFYGDSGHLVASCAQEVSLRRVTRPRDYG